MEKCPAGRESGMHGGVGGLCGGAGGVSCPAMTTSAPIPYKIAVLCDLRDAQGRVLLIHRAKAPNQGMYSPIGGKLDTETGESPAQCAQREIHEEAGIDVPIERLRLAGVISEQAYENETHWLLFVYRVTGAVEVQAGPMNEGVLDWHAPDEVDALPLPETDLKVLWPMLKSHEEGFFAVHIDCSGDEISWSVEQSHT